MCWISKWSGGGLLNPTESVVETLKSKHPEPKIPSDDSIPCWENLPYFEDTEITAAHVQFVAGRLQGQAGPGGYQSAHWQDAFL